MLLTKTGGRRYLRSLLFHSRQARGTFEKGPRLFLPSVTCVVMVLRPSQARHPPTAWFEAVGVDRRRGRRAEGGRNVHLHCCIGNPAANRGGEPRKKTPPRRVSKSEMRLCQGAKKEMLPLLGGTSPPMPSVEVGDTTKPRNKVVPAASGGRPPRAGCRSRRYDQARGHRPRRSK